jgi:hypothetical protein
VLTRSIEFDSFGETIEEKLFRNAKRICIIFAVGAVTLSALDIANIHTVGNAAALIRNSNFADLPDQIRSGIERISFTSDEPVAVAAIPMGASVSVAIKTQRPARPASSVVDGLVATSNQDAVEFAMATQQPSYTRAAVRAGEPTEPFKLASVDMNAMPSDLVPQSASLPMSGAIPLAMVPLPREAPGVPPPSPAERLHLEGKERAKAERCLANAIYFEARSEPVRGQMAVAQVVVNRAFSGFYPNDICGVVYQNASRHLSCQFTFACDGKSKAITERGHWARAARIAKETLDGKIYVPEVAKSTHYHALYVHPNWVGEMKKMVRYGLHNFYRPYAWGNGADEPVWGPTALAQNKKK